jgi:hypothetical protein
LIAITHPQIHNATPNRIAKVELQIFLMVSARDAVLEEDERERKDDNEDRRTRGPENWWMLVLKCGSNPSQGHPPKSPNINLPSIVEGYRIVRN